MQGCFRNYPEIYGSELESDADDDEDDLSTEGAPAALADSANSTTETVNTTTSHDTQPKSDPLNADARKHDAGLVPGSYRPSGETERANKATEQVKRDHEPTNESERLVPRAAHDASDATVEKK